MEGKEVDHSNIACFGINITESAGNRTETELPTHDILDVEQGGDQVYFGMGSQTTGVAQNIITVVPGNDSIVATGAVGRTGRPRICVS